MVADDTTDPISFCQYLWPHVEFYREQQDIIYSVQDNDETFVPAGNMLGKDFVASFVILWFFLTRHPCRIVTTSAKEDHLRVLWGEMGRFIQECRYPLTTDRGGPLIVNHREIRKVYGGKECPLSYIKGMVASNDSLAAMQGHHIAKIGDGVPRTLFVPDECSSVPDEYYRMAITWFNRMLAIGNPWPCENFFKHAVKGKPGTDDRGGDIKADDNGHYYRKVIKIRAEDSPNVIHGLEQKANGEKPTDDIIIPGVKSYAEYVKNRRMWDKVQQCVSLDGEFYEGAEVMLYPPEWLNAAEQYADELDRKGGRRVGRVMGVDPAEGGDSSSWAIIDDLGLIHLLSLKTPNTTEVTSRTLALMREYNIDPINILFDRGGGGQEHADRLRQQGHDVRTIGFGEAATISDKFVRRMRTTKERKGELETKYVYRNRRAEMYGILRQLLDLSQEKRFGIPRRYANLRSELAPIPLQYDPEGRLELPPKNKRPDTDSKKVTLIDLIGHSPDEADALALAVFGLKNKMHKSFAGAMTL